MWLCLGRSIEQQAISVSISVLRRSNYERTGYFIRRIGKRPIGKHIANKINNSKSWMINHSVENMTKGDSTNQE